MKKIPPWVVWLVVLGALTAGWYTGLLPLPL